MKSRATAPGGRCRRPTTISISSTWRIIHLRNTKDAAFLGKNVQGVTLLDRLCKAFHVPASDPHTGTVVTDPGRAVGFGFQDTVYLLGAMAFATLLRWQAARELVDLCKAAGKSSAADEFEKIAATIAANLVPTFPRSAKDRRLAARRRNSAASRMFGATLYALHLGILPKDAQQRCARDGCGRAADRPGEAHHRVPGRADTCQRPSTTRRRVPGKARTAAKAAIRTRATGTPRPDG